MNMRFLKITIAALALCAGRTRPCAAAGDDALLPPTHDYRPALIYFGAYRRNEPLAEKPDQWRYVQTHADGFLMHFGYWLNNDYNADPVAAGKALGPVLRKNGLKTIVEIGFPSTQPTPQIDDDMGRLTAQKYAAKINEFEASSGMRIDEIECELRLSIFGILAERHPDWSAGDIFQQITGKPSPAGTSAVATKAFWPDFIAAMNAGVGERPIYVGCPPVYVPWKNLLVTGRNMKYVRKSDRDAAGKSKPDAAALTFDGPAFWDAIFKSDVKGFLCDSPWFLIGNEAYAAKGYRKKLADLTRFTHARGKSFSFIVNASPKKGMTDDGLALGGGEASNGKYEAEWDKRYTEQSMQSLVTYQLAGGRADRYIFESWYDGPYTIVPDTQPNTFTNLVRQGIDYLKGPGQTMTFGTKTAAGGENTVTLTNTGSVACLPAVRVTADGTAAKVTLGDEDVTAEATTPEGVTARKLLSPGESLTLIVRGPASLAALWNPQDPGNVERARATVK